MPIFSRRRGALEATEENSEIVRGVMGGGLATILVSGLALAFSAVSLYETVLRQPELSVYVPPVIHYTRERGGEVFAVPVTIANHGARDGVVLSLELEATSNTRTKPKVLYSAYSVESEYFERARLQRSATGGLVLTKERPKTPFAPLSIAGRANYSGTILFFSKNEESPFLISGPSELKLTLRLNTSFEDSGWLDRLWAPRTTPASFSVKLQRFNRRVVARGESFELKSASW